MDNVNFGQKLILAVLVPLATVLVGWLTWLTTRGKNRIDAGKVAHDAAISIINELQEERELIRKERREFHEERVAWNAERADFRRRLIECEANQRGLEQYVYSLETLLRRAGIDIPKRPPVQPMIIIETECPTPLIPHQTEQ